MIMPFADKKDGIFFEGVEPWMKRIQNRNKIEIRKKEFRFTI